MPSRTFEDSTKSDMSSRGWACCKCLYLNSGGRHVCQGVIPLRGDYDEACNHWHCPSCRGAGNSTPSLTNTLRHIIDSLTPALAYPTHAADDPPLATTNRLPFANPYPPSAPSEPPLQFEPHHHGHSHSHPNPHSHSNPHSNTHSYPYPHSHPHPQPHPQSHTQSPSPPQQQQQQPTPRDTAPAAAFSHTTAYLQRAARRPSAITFADAFPAPVSLPCVEPVQALAGLRLDYSAGNYAGGNYARGRGRYTTGGWGGEGDGGNGDGGDGDGDGGGVYPPPQGGDGGYGGGGVYRDGEGKGDGGYWGDGGGGGDAYRGGDEYRHGDGDVDEGKYGSRDAEGGWWQEKDGERDESGKGRNERKRKAEKDKGKNGGMCKKLDKGKGKGRETVSRKAKGKEKETRGCPGVAPVCYPAGYQPASVEDVFDAGREDEYEYDHGYGKWDGMEREW